MDSLKKYFAKSIALFFLTVVGFLPSCEEDSKVFTLGVDVQSYFEQDDVQVFVDDKLIIDEELQTNLTVGVCLEGVVQLKKNEGSHSIKVVINNTATKTETFSLKNNRYIGVNFNPFTSEISFIYSDQQFLYD